MEGVLEGTELGALEGDRDGMPEGERLGVDDGNKLGSADGKLVGAGVGGSVGVSVGGSVGLTLGVPGDTVGMGDGFDVGKRAHGHKTWCFNYAVRGMKCADPRFCGTAIFLAVKFKGHLGIGKEIDLWHSAPLAPQPGGKRTGLLVMVPNSQNVP